MVLRSALLTAALLAAVVPAARADEASPDFAVVGARVVTAAGDDIPDGVVVVKDGRIEVVGTREDVQVPRGVETIDGAGKVLLPSFVHAASRIGLRGSGSGGDPGAAAGSDPADQPGCADPGRAGEHA